MAANVPRIPNFQAQQVAGHNQLMLYGANFLQPATLLWIQASMQTLTMLTAGEQELAHFMMIFLAIIGFATPLQLAGLLQTPRRGHLFQNALNALQTAGFLIIYAQDANTIYLRLSQLFGPFLQLPNAVYVQAVVNGSSPRIERNQVCPIHANHTPPPHSVVGGFQNIITRYTYANLPVQANVNAPVAPVAPVVAAAPTLQAAAAAMPDTNAHRDNEDRTNSAGHPAACRRATATNGRLVSPNQDIAHEQGRRVRRRIIAEANNGAGMEENNDDDDETSDYVPEYEEEEHEEEEESEEDETTDGE